jgi:hypothetical protein
VVSIFTKKRFNIKGKAKPVKGIVIPDNGNADLSTFFDKVTMPDEVNAVEAEG